MTKLDEIRARAENSIVTGSVEEIRYLLTRIAELEAEVKATRTRFCKDCVGAERAPTSCGCSICHHGDKWKWRHARREEDNNG